jgi:hypothetical protein
MFDFKITCDNGAISIIRARNRSTAIKLFCEAEGCPIDWFLKHCVIRNITGKKKGETDESEDTEGACEFSETSAAEIRRRRNLNRARMRARAEQQKNIINKNFKK